MSDIVERLRNAPRQPDCPHGLRPKSCKDCDIAELEAEIERLKAALKFYADKDHYEYFPGARARAELEGKG